MRNISFALTTQQLRERTKTVTRRLGWQHVKPGELLKPVERCMGLQRGQKIVPICAPIRVVSVGREPLRLLTDDLDYGFAEVAAEGFRDHPWVQGFPSRFLVFFCDSHRHCTPETVITRIEFEYT